MKGGRGVAAPRRIGVARGTRGGLEHTPRLLTEGGSQLARMGGVGYFSPGLRLRSGRALAQHLRALTILGRDAAQSDGVVAEWSGHFRGVRTPSTSGDQRVRFGPHWAHQMQASPSISKRPQASPKEKAGVERCRACLESVARADGLCPPVPTRIRWIRWMCALDSGFCGGAAKHFDAPGLVWQLTPGSFIKSTFWAGSGWLEERPT